jgi:hypothetical protein
MAETWKRCEIIADNLHDAGWSLGWVSAVDLEGRTYESVIMQPVFLGQEQAIDYAKGRACFGFGEIRILD